MYICNVCRIHFCNNHVWSSLSSDWALAEWQEEKFMHCFIRRPLVLKQNHCACLLHFFYCVRVCGSRGHNFVRRRILIKVKVTATKNYFLFWDTAGCVLGLKFCGLIKVDVASSICHYRHHQQLGYQARETPNLSKFGDLKAEIWTENSFRSCSVVAVRTSSKKIKYLA